MCHELLIGHWWEDRPLFIVVWILLSIVGSKADVKHVCFLVGYAVDAAKNATGKMYLFPRKPTKGVYSLTVTDRIYASNGSCIFF
jgi:hypothetical protein